MRRSRINLVLVICCLLGSNHFAHSDTAADRKNTDAAALMRELRAIRANAETPEAKVAAVAEWIKSHPLPAIIASPESSKTAAKSRSTSLSEDATLRFEIKDGLKATRAMAKTPEESIALVAEFQRLNAEAIASARALKPAPLGIQSFQGRLEEFQRSRINVNANPNNERLKLAVDIQRVRSTSKDPEELIEKMAILIERNTKRMGTMDKR